MVEIENVPVCHIDHLLVRHELPEAVGRQDEALVIISDIELRELELGAVGGGDLSAADHARAEIHSYEGTKRASEYQLY